MSYFTGKNLERKIKEFALEEIDQILQEIMNGEGRWPGDLAVPAESDILEATRIVLYSLLHKYGVKDEFRVKMITAKNVIVIGLKVGKTKRKGEVQKWGSSASPYALPPAADVPEKKEDYNQMLKDESTSWE